MAKYSLEFKMKLVNEYNEGSAGRNTIARKYNVYPSVLYNWINKYKHHGIEGLKKSRSNTDYDVDLNYK